MSATETKEVTEKERKTRTMWLFLILSYLSLAFATMNTASPRKIALITGGTRGIGSGISEALAEEGYDLLLSYNTNQKEATEFSKSIRSRYGDSCQRVECVGGDISLPETRDAIFACLDSMLNEKESPSSCLAVIYPSVKS